MTKYLMAFTIPLSVYISLTSQGALSWLAITFSFGLLPLIELALSKRQWPNTPGQKELSKHDWIYDFLLFLAPPVQVFLIFVFLEQIESSSSLDILAKILALGISCGVIGINVGHELGHRSGLASRVTAVFLLSTSLYSHFFIEHNKGHHRHVGTPEDPATARFGENLYRFFLRSMTGCLKSALRLDKKLFFALQLYQLAGLYLIYSFYGFAPTLFFIGAAFFGAINLEIVNYIEHYGLMRKTNSSGRYEKVTPMHSWNSNQPIGRSILFELTRHSDHHAHISRTYYQLENSPSAPQLPAGYPTMMALATIPPLFFKVMNPRAEQYQ